VDDLADRDLGEQFVQFHEDRGALSPDFEHLVIGERREATDPQRRDLFHETFGSRGKRKERAAVGREVRWPNPGDPSVAVDGLGHGSRIRQDLGVDFLQDAPDGRADRAEVLAALQETDGRALGPLDARRLARYLRDAAGNRGIDARDAHLDVARGQGPSPNEPIRIVEEIVREFTAVDLHLLLLNQRGVCE